MKDIGTFGRWLGAIAGALLATAACGPPPQIKASPATVTLREAFPPAGGREPAAAARVELRSSSPDASLGWKLTGAPVWIKPSALAGGTPADLDLRFDLSEMHYGVNDAGLILHQGETTSLITVNYLLQGALVIGPTQSIALRGVVGKAESAAVTLTIDSPGKPGLAWTASTPDPWIALDTLSGVTPARVKVTARLAQATSNASGRIEFASPHAASGSPTVVPVVVEILNPDAVKRQLSAKLTVLTEEAAASRKAFDALVADIRSHATIDDFLAAARTTTERAEAAAKKVAALCDDLTRFIDQNAAYRDLVPFQEYRRSADEAATASQAVALGMRHALDGARRVTVEVSAKGEWQPLGLSVADGDAISFGATGTWTLGPLAGRSGPEGRNDPNYTRAAVESAYNFGGLMLRAGDTTFAVARSAGTTRSRWTGPLVGRCNDKDYTNNSGAMSVTVVVVPLPKL